MGKPAVDLSEMFVVHRPYTDNAEKYLRMNGTSNFVGGSFYDDVYVLKNYGIVPDSVMNGLNYGETKHVHGELDALTSAFMTTMVKNPNKNNFHCMETGFRRYSECISRKTAHRIYSKRKKHTPVSYANSLA